MKKRVFFTGILAVMLVFGLTFASCDNGTTTGGGSSNSSASCDDRNNCTGGTEYCGRSGCDAQYYGEQCDCR
jgi:hypothetical protein